MNTTEHRSPKNADIDFEQMGTFRRKLSNTSLTTVEKERKITCRPTLLMESSDLVITCRFACGYVRTQIWQQNRLYGLLNRMIAWLSKGVGGWS